MLCTLMGRYWKTETKLRNLELLYVLLQLQTSHVSSIYKYKLNT